MLRAIALHRVRRAWAGLGDVVAVLGLGVLGQLTAQLLRSAGRRVVGYDPAPGRAAAARRLSQGAGVDAVIVTASTASDAPRDLAAEVARVRGTVVMVGVTGMRVPRRCRPSSSLGGPRRPIDVDAPSGRMRQ